MGWGFEHSGRWGGDLSTADDGVGDLSTADDGVGDLSTTDEGVGLVDLSPTE